MIFSAESVGNSDTVSSELELSEETMSEAIQRLVLCHLSITTTV